MANSRFYLVLLCLFWALPSVAVPPALVSEEISRIVFGSCLHQNKAQPIWTAINAERADLFIFLGDNIYGDTRDMEVLKQKYRQLGASRGFQQLEETTPVVAIWDDHDFGENDAGREYPHKEASRKIMLDFFKEPEDSKRRTQSDGIYTSYYFGEGDKRVQLILLDLRWNRSLPEVQSQIAYYLSSYWQDRGPYKETKGKDATILGENQWQWFEEELKRPAAIRIIGSSLPVLAEGTGWETWSTFPHERKRLLNTIKEAKLEGVFFISGDTHWSEFSQVENALDYPAWDLTSSGLTEEWKQVSPNPHRIGEYFASANYGLIEVDWSVDPKITLSIKDVNGKIKMQQVLKIEDLAF